MAHSLPKPGWQLIQKHVRDNKEKDIERHYQKRGLIFPMMSGNVLYIVPLITRLLAKAEK